MKGKIFNILVILALVLSFSTVALAQDGGLQPVTGSLSISGEATNLEEKSPAGLDAAAIAAADLGTVSVIVTFDGPVSAAELEAATGGTVVYEYSQVFNGASIVLDGAAVKSLAAVNGVSGIYLDELLQPDTEVSPGFIGAPTIWDMLGGQGSAGEGVIVGVLDTGIWPEHPSFSDPDPFGTPYAPPHTVPGSNGFGSGGARSTCDFGDTAWNPNDAPFTCNNKLIGAYDFLDTYKAVVGLLPNEFDSARDDNGHGTHTTSTSAGNGGVAASIFGVPRGTISGVAPRAHVIMYRVCGDEGCYSSDSARAVEQAILDNVDSINFSISGGGNPYSDVVSLAFLSAYENGVFVAASAGNSGPGANTTAHREPWTTTVAASTSNRHFLATLSLFADNGDSLSLTGATVTDGISTPTEAIYPPAGSELCLTPFPAGTFNGEIVICERGVIARVAKSFNVAAGGAGGLILYNPALQGLNTDNHFIPSVHLDYNEGVQLNDFMAAHTGVMATFTGGTASVVQGDVMAAFSSRGGPAQNLGVSKPDITAPGVQILAGHSPMPATVEGGLPGELFQAIQGTSMSSPHIAGSAALLKALHPDWTPGQIKSAMMMTAKTKAVKEDGVTPADPFDYGSGRVDLRKAGDPGLTVSDSGANFVALEDELWNSNYPSIYIPNMPGRITVLRTLHSELDADVTWGLGSVSPDDVDIMVPFNVMVPAHGDATIAITIDARMVPQGEVRFATLIIKSRGHVLHMPVTIVRGQPSVTLEKSCAPAEFSVGETTDCTITIENTGMDEATVSLVDRLPRQLWLVDDSLEGATRRSKNLFTFADTLYGAGAPVVEVVPGELYGYLPLADFGIGTVPLPSNPDDGGWVISGLDINYLGVHYTNAIWSVNGTLELGTASGVYASFANQNMPSTAIPNNVLAPWWTDLNLTDAGNLRLGALSDGVSTWDIFEWENVPRFGDLGSTFSFQIWLEQGTGNITFTYGPFAGDTGDGSTGAENADGTVGDTVYYDGAGTLPWGGGDLAVNSVPGTPGETHVISYSAFSAMFFGPWTNCAMMTSDAFQGENISCFSGVTFPGDN